MISFITALMPIRTKKTYKRLSKGAGIASLVSLATFIGLFYSCVQLARHRAIHHSTSQPGFDWIAIFCDVALLATIICVTVYLAAVVLKCLAPNESTR